MGSKLKLKYFTEDNVREVVLFWELKNLDVTPQQTIARIGGVKRRVRAYHICKFCEKLDFPDISMWTVRYVMKQLFGVAVSTQMLQKWATPGRKANDRVNQDILFDSISDSTREDAKQLLADINVEWKQVTKAARTMLES